jgi:hypothetical protein
MRDEFRKFLGALPARDGYCAACLSVLYGEPVETIHRHIGELTLPRGTTECGNCGQYVETYRTRATA